MQELVKQIEEELKCPSGKLDMMITEALHSEKNVQELLLVAEVLMKNNKYPEANRILKSIEEAEPENGHAAYLLGSASVALNEVEQSEAYFEKALRLNYAPEKSAAAIAMVEKALGKKRKAEQLLKQAGEAEDASLLPQMLLYSLYMEQSRFADADTVSENICETIPQSYFGYHTKYVSLLKQKRYEEAKGCLDSVSTQFADQQEYIYDYVSALLLLKKPKEADEYWQSVQDKLDTSSLRFMRIEAQIASDLHDKDRAYEANINLYKRYGIENAAISVALLYIGDQEFSSALEYVKPVAEKKLYTKAYYTAVYLKAFCVENTSPSEAEAAYQKATQIYEEAYKKNKINTYVMSYAAECYRKLGDTENALRCEMIVKEFRNKYNVPVNDETKQQ